MRVRVCVAGGDEVKESHWSSDPTVAAFMKAHGLASTTALYAYYENKLQAIARGPSVNRTCVNWVSSQHTPQPRAPVALVALPDSAELAGFSPF